MDADTEETVTEISKTQRNLKDESERPINENKARGRGFRGRGRGVWMSRGGMRGGMIKGFGPPGHGRGRGKDGAMNGFAPMRGMGRMRPYPDMRGHRGRGGPMGMGPPPPPPMHLRGPFPPMPRHRPPPPPGHPGFRGRPPHPCHRGMLPPGPPRHFHPRGPRGHPVSLKKMS
ncbi:hypothetical protein PAMP_014113 [Pampus punctatissimus]